tara:strand:- start:272 stop:2170 length:1899 start_codon:yes stop_codon:yes gene_type:complete
LTLIIPINYLLIVNYFLARNGIRVSIINAFLVLSIQIFFITELLSLLSLLNTITVFVSHLLFAIFYFTLLKNISKPQIKFFSNDIINNLLIGSIFFIAFTTFLIAIISPPNNWDSMTYHMSRVQYWMQNNDVDFFDTNNIRQNLMSPFSGFVLLNLQILSNSDLFANLLQWVSLLNCMLIISLICKEFGLNKRLQLISAFFICSMPTAILEASSTQNDLLLSSYVLLFYYYQLLTIKNPSGINIMFSGFSLGLGILTKGTSYVFLFSIGITFFIYSILYRYPINRITVLYRSIISIIIGLSINIPHYFRTYIKYDDIFGLSYNQVAANEVFSVYTIFSNLIRHIAYQLGSSISIANWYIYRVVQILLGDNINDPKTSFIDRDFRPPFFSLSEDHAGNSIHTLIIIILCMLSFIFFKKLKKTQLTSLWIFSISVILYCLLFKWQPWTNKIISLLIINTPFSMIITDQIFKNKSLRINIYIILIIMFLGSLPYLFYNVSRPLFPLNEKSIIYKNRAEGYFNNRPDLFKQYQRIINKIDIDINESLSKQSIALHIGGDSWDYPFWVMLKNKLGNEHPYFFHLVTDHIEIIRKDNNYPKYIIFENKLLNNLKNIKKNYTTVILDENFSLMKIINKG